MGNAARMWEDRNAYIILVGKPEGKRILVISRHKLDDNIKIDLKEIAWEVVGWINLAERHVAGSCEYGNEPSGCLKCGEFPDKMRIC
jgi:hypothetical protein